MSCTKSDERVVDAELAPYFELFALEGEKRNVKVDYDALHVEGMVRTIEGRTVVGQCSHSEDAPNLVIVDPILWRRASEAQREQIIFHELGHCFLQRSHKDDQDANGICRSIMHSSTEVCSINYEQNRDFYLDELFAN